MLVYGLNLYIKDRGKTVSLLQFLIYTGLPLAPWFAAMAWDGGKILEDYRDALNIVPPQNITFETLRFSWFRQEVTWDQIQVTGLYRGFLPVVVVTSFLLPTAIWTKKREALLFLLAGGGGLAANMIAHQIGFSWYRFFADDLDFCRTGNLAGRNPFWFSFTSPVFFGKHFLDLWVKSDWRTDCLQKGCQRSNLREQNLPCYRYVEA